MNPDITNSLVQLTKCNINYFKNKQKGIVSTGPCSVLKTGSTISFKSQKTTIQIQKKQTVVRVTEITYTTYLHLHETNGVYAISCQNSDPLNQIFYNVLSQNIQVLDYYMLPPDLQLKQKITAQITLGEPGAPELGATNDDKLQQIGEGIGNVLGGISSLIDTSKLNRQSQAAITRFSVNTFGEGTLSKWQQFKNKCSQLNDKVTEVFKPINNKCSQIATDVGNKFQASDNSFIKNVREYSKKTETALNTGYQKGDAPRRASYMPPPGSANNKSQMKQETPKDNNTRTVNFGNNSKILQQQKINERKSLL